MFSEAGNARAVLITSLVFALCLVVFFILRRVAFGSFSKWARKTDTRADDIVIDAIAHPSFYWVIAVSLYIALDTSAFPAKYVGYGLSVLHVLIVLSITLAVANISSSLVQNAMRKTSPNVPITGLSRAVIRGVIFTLGFLVILNNLGISITPILTALGVGGLAVALALQDTLSNLFAGMHILIEQQVRVGDFVRLNTGEEGFVSDIGWRTTRLRQLTNNIVIIPNNKLSSSTITNFHLPAPKTALAVKVGVDYSSDADLVEAVLLDEAKKAVGTVKGGLQDPPPVARLTGFAESALEFTVTCHVSEYADQFEAQHELRKMILRRLKAEHIVIPFPTRTVELRDRRGD